MRSASFEHAISFAADLIRTPGLPGQEAAVAARVREEMEALGLADVRVDAAGNVIGVARGRGEAPPVMLVSHLDVVAEDLLFEPAAPAWLPGSAAIAAARAQDTNVPPARRTW